MKKLIVALLIAALIAAPVRAENYGSTPQIDIPANGEGNWGPKVRAAFQALDDFLAKFANPDGTLKTTTTATPWQAVTSTVTYVSASSFSVDSSLASYFEVGRKVWLVQATQVIGSVSAVSTVGAVTTVTLDSIVLYSDNFTPATVTTPITSVSVSMATQRSVPFNTHRYNCVINGSGIVAQRTTGTDVIKNASASTYVFGAPDRFTGAWSGTACTAGSLTQDSAANVGRTGYAHHFSGVTLTGTGVLYHRHRIESLIAKNYKNQTCSLSVKVLHDVGSNVNFTAYLRKPTTTADVFSAVTEIANSGQVSIASGASATLTFQNVAMGDCSKGIEIEIKAEVGAITSKNLRLMEYQLEVGSVATDFEFEDYSETLAKCQRYYLDWQGANGTHLWLDSWLPVGQNQVVSFGFPVQMRVAPTVIKTGTWAVGNTGQPTINATTPNGTSLLISATPGSGRTYATPSGVAATGLTASAEL